MESTKIIIEIIESSVTIFAILFGAFVAIYFFVQFTPKIDLRIIPEWIDKSKRKLVVRFEIENKSQVRINVKRFTKSQQNKNLMILVQILEYYKANTSTLSEWVPFSKNDIRDKEEPIEWNDPEFICQTTNHIYPGETVKVNRLYTFPEDKIWHIGFQIQTEYNFIEKMLIWKLSKRWTTTKIFCLD